MSSSIAIPTAPSSAGAHDRHNHHRHHHRSVNALIASSADSTSSAMSPSSSTSSHSPAPSSADSCDTPSTPSRTKASAFLQSTSSSVSTLKEQWLHQRRPSLLSSSISKQEAQVINIGDPDGPPRLISYLSSSQGFTWNPEIFVPSYVNYDYTPLENRREPVHEILLSDEEIAAMFPN